MPTSLRHPLPPLGAMVAIDDPTAPPIFSAPVDMHLGRYFYAGGYRFHVADDYKPMGSRQIWQTAAATALLLNPHEVFHADAATVAWAQQLEPAGPAEPTEEW